MFKTIIVHFIEVLLFGTALQFMFEKIIGYSRIKALAVAYLLAPWIAGAIMLYMLEVYNFETLYLNTAMASLPALIILAGWLIIGQVERSKR